MTTVDDPIARIRAVVDEDERIAKAALDPGDKGSYLPDHYITDEQERFEERFTPEVAQRIAAAHRKILEFTEVLRADYRDNDAEYLVGLLAETYEIDTFSREVPDGWGPNAVSDEP